MATAPVRVPAQPAVAASSRGREPVDVHRRPAHHGGARRPTAGAAGPGRPPGAGRRPGVLGGRPRAADGVLGRRRCRPCGGHVGRRREPVLLLDGGLLRKRGRRRPRPRLPPGGARLPLLRAVRHTGRRRSAPPCLRPLPVLHQLFRPPTPARVRGAAGLQTAPSPPRHCPAKGTGAGGQPGGEPGVGPALRHSRRTTLVGRRTRPGPRYLRLRPARRRPPAPAGPRPR